MNSSGGNVKIRRRHTAKGNIVLSAKRKDPRHTPRHSNLKFWTRQGDRWLFVVFFFTFLPQAFDIQRCKHQSLITALPQFALLPSSRLPYMNVLPLINCTPGGPFLICIYFFLSPCTFLLFSPLMHQDQDACLLLACFAFSPIISSAPQVFRQTSSLFLTQFPFPIPVPTHMHQSVYM